MSPISNSIAKEEQLNVAPFGRTAVDLRPLLVTDSDVFAGTERHILDLSRAFTERNIPVCIACPIDSALETRAKEAGIETITAPKKGFALAVIAPIIKRISQGKCNIIHAHNGVSQIPSVVASLLTRRVRCIATQHFVNPARTTRRGWKAVLSRQAHRWVDGNTDFFIAISQAVATSFKKIKSGSDNIVVVHNGIYSDFAVSRSAAQVRAQLGLAPQTQLIVCAARLVPEKNLDVLIQALPQVLASFPNVRCVIAGGGEGKSELSALIARLGLNGVVQLLGYQQDSISIINACEIFVLPSECEPFGLVVLEAMALGKPVVAANAGGPKELIAHGKTGQLFAAGSPESLAEQLTLLLKDPELRDRLAIEGREHCRRHFSAQEMATRMVAVYEAAWRG